jgi:hypothetical protein
MEPIRFLYLPFERELGGQIDLRKAFSSLADQKEFEAYEAYPFLIKQVELGSWEAMLKDLILFVNKFKPSAILWELHDSGYVPEETILKIKSASSDNLVFCQLNGDIRYKPIPEMVQLGKHIDITYISSSGQISEYEEAGCKIVKLLPHWCNPENFESEPWKPSEKRDFDVVMVSTLSGFRGYQGPFLKGFDGQKDRRLLGKALNKRYGKRLGLYGKGWEWLSKSNQGIIPFRDQFKIIRNAWCSIGTNNFNFVNHYCSDRPFISMGSGVPHLTRYTPYAEDFFRDGEHLFFFHNIDEAIKKIDKILENPLLYQETIGKNGFDLIQKKHTADQRTLEIISDIKNYRKNGESDIVLRNSSFLNQKKQLLY